MRGRAPVNPACNGRSNGPSQGQTLVVLASLLGGVVIGSGARLANAEERPTTPYFTLGPVVVHGTRPMR